MAATPTPAQATKSQRRHRFRDFWERVTEGAELDQLGSQFVSDAKASYALYSKDVDWDEIGRSSRGPGRIWRSAWALFQAMLMKLTPARRVLLLIAIVLIFCSARRSLGSQRRSQLPILADSVIAILFRAAGR